MLLLSIAALSNAQDEQVASSDADVKAKQKKETVINNVLPSTGDFAIGVDAIPYINFLGNMFSGATSFNGDITDWDMSNVTEASTMFEDAVSFNRDIGNWDMR